MAYKIYIHATNVHQGGGRSLLDALLRALDEKMEYVLSLDERMPLPDAISSNIRINRTKPTLMARLSAERWLFRSVSSEDTVLCFGNLPPLFKLRGRTSVFVQNRYIVDDVALDGFPLIVRLRLAMERLWFFSRISNVSEIIVQTPTMKNLLEKSNTGKATIRVLPFVDNPDGYDRCLKTPAIKKQTDCDFVYVASGEKHKNHINLVQAWCILADEGLFPSLCFTLNEAVFAELCAEIDLMRRKYGLKIENKGCQSHRQVLKLYEGAGAVIYPSVFESFGLPLIEARQAGLPVLASELDYVRDVLDPEQTFDPDSSVSIARAVKRFMSRGEQPLPLLNATQFMASVLEKAE